MVLGVVGAIGPELHDIKNLRSVRAMHVECEVDRAEFSVQEQPSRPLWDSISCIIPVLVVQDAVPIDIDEADIARLRRRLDDVCSYFRGVLKDPVGFVNVEFADRIVDCCPSNSERPCENELATVS